MNKIKCEKCGKEIDHIMLNVFSYDGANREVKYPFTVTDSGAVLIDTRSHWCGYGLDEEEMREEITCPHCHQFPFNDTEVQVYDMVRVVCFRNAR